MPIRVLWKFIASAEHQSTEDDIADYMSISKVCMNNLREIDDLRNGGHGVSLTIVMQMHVFIYFSGAFVD